MSPVAETRSGLVRGVAERDVLVFKGIPYAAPPVGERRLRPPAPETPWTGERDGTEYAAWAPQRAAANGIGVELGAVDEDCLTLNVWTPSLDGRRPVMVWIHGGAFLTGSGASVVYRGHTLAARGDVVVVTINYRLGVLGWLSHPSLADDKTGAVGNWGLLDQMAALRWVRENAGAFGGDPGNVTVFGESAGAMSVGTLLATPAARPLIDKAIMQSGPPFAIAADEVSATAEEVAAALGLTPAELPKLRDLPLDVLLDAQEAVARGADSTRLALPFGPTIDGTVVPGDPVAAVATGAAADIPQLSGTNRDEVKLWALGIPGVQSLDDDALVAQLAPSVGEARASAALAAYRQARDGRGDPTTPFELWSAIASDWIFRVPAMRAAAGHAAAGGSAHTYLFTWESPAFGGLLGSCHALEIPFVFGSSTRRSLKPFCGEGPEADALATAMQDAWLSFARTADPGWPPYDATGRTTKVFGRQMETAAAPMEDERAFWD